MAIAASYLRADDLVALRGFVAGFESVTPLTTGERELLYELVRVRLAATISILHWRAQARHADDPYLTKVSSEQSAEQFFGHLTALGKARFDAQISAG